MFQVCQLSAGFSELRFNSLLFVLHHLQVCPQPHDDLLGFCPARLDLHELCFEFLLSGLHVIRIRHNPRDGCFGLKTSGFGLLQSFLDLDFFSGDLMVFRHHLCKALLSFRKLQRGFLQIVFECSLLRAELAGFGLQLFE